MRLGLLFCALVISSTLSATELRVAVAANFANTLNTLIAAYPEAVEFQLSLGASGALATQILQGAPFDLFFSADAERPQRLVDAGLAGPATTYAYGLLALWSPRLTPATAAQLSHPSVRFVAIPDPRLAPYGLAAEAVLAELGLLHQLRLVRGQSVGQSLQHIASGAADLGFVALSQLRTIKVPEEHVWLPTTAPLLTQQAVVLARAAEPESARAFLHWVVHSPEAQRILIDAGYRIPEAPHEPR